jgi:hypothetical protein
MTIDDDTPAWLASLDDGPAAEWTYRRIKEQAAASRGRVPDLLAMSRTKDPFFCGSPSDVRDAEWFAAVWQRFGYSTGLHLRRIHYQLVVQPEVERIGPDGQPYLNTERHWDRLQEASTAARYLGMVDAAAFVDRRNPTAVIYDAERANHRQLDVDRYLYSPYGSADAWQLRQIDAELDAELTYLQLDPPRALGYDYQTADQGWLVELWCEKTTQNDILLPICEELGVNLVTAAGFESITAIVDLLVSRVAASERPARLFYLSDFDPAGKHMPTAVARQVEFWRRRYAPEADIKLTPLVLTPEQADGYNLPRSPIKASDVRKDSFEAIWGAGATELDALEALAPGELARIVRTAISQYRDRQLPSRLQVTKADAQRATDAAWREATEAERTELDDIKSEADAVLVGYQRQLESLSAALADDLAPLQERLDAVRHAVQERLAELEVDLPERPVAETADVDESDWLFDADRDYLEQPVPWVADSSDKGPPMTPTVIP